MKEILCLGASITFHAQTFLEDVHISVWYKWSLLSSVPTFITCAFGPIVPPYNVLPCHVTFETIVSQFKRFVVAGHSMAQVVPPKRSTAAMLKN